MSRRGEPDTELARALARIVELEVEHERLALAEARLADFADVSADWFWETDAELRFTWISEGVRRLGAWPPQWYCGRSRDDLIGEHTDPDQLAEHRRALASREPFRGFVYQRRAHDGAPLWTSTSGKPFFDATGRFAGYRGSARDVTAEMLAERRLRESEKRFADFARVSSDWFWEMGPDLRYTYFSPSVERFHGLPPEHFYGKTQADLRQEGDDAEAWEAHERVLAAREPYRGLVITRRLRDGSVRYVKSDGNPVFDDDGTFLGYRGTGRDITDEVLAQRRLRESEAMLSAIVEHMPSHLSLKDAEGRIELANRAWLEWHGCSLGQVRGRTMAALLPEELAAAIEAEDLRVVETGAPIVDELETIGAGGRRGVFLTQRFPVFDADGAVRGVGAFSTDISERKRIERELEEHRSGLERLVAQRTAELESAHREVMRQERLAALGQIIGTVSHELRNPLGTIQTTAYTLRAELGSLGPGQQRAFNRIQRNIERCVLIIEDLLSYSRVRPLAPRSLDVDSWLAALVEETPVPDGIRLVLESAVTQAVHADPDRLRQAVLNLVQNACQAIVGERDDGPVAGEVRVAASVEDGMLRIEVRDDGPGVDEAVAARVFEPMFSTKSFGFGLGMPLVRQIAEQHGGSASFASTPGVGTRVVLRIACRPPRGAKAGTAPGGL